MKWWVGTAFAMFGRLLSGPPSARPMALALAAGLSLAFATGPLHAQAGDSTALPPDPLAAASRAAVDRFVHALDGDDSAAVFGALDPAVEGYHFDYARGSFERIPAKYFPGPYFGSYLRNRPFRITVGQRAVSGAFVFQVERYDGGPPEHRESWTAPVLYRVADGRVRTVWFLPEAPNPAMVPAVANPAFPAGHGAVVYIDAGHHELHTMDGTFWPFAELLRRDGYVVHQWEGPLSRAGLDSAGVDVLVIANALAERNASEGWSLPTPSAFSDEEVEAVRKWVGDGGALLLISDHMPFAGAAGRLGAAFGVRFQNGLAEDTTTRGGDVFRRADGTLHANVITDGVVGPAGRVDSVATFGGQAWPPTADLEPIITMSPHTVLLYPSSWPEVSDSTPRRSAAGWVQAGIRRYGKGRVALFGEAMMFWSALRETYGRAAVGQNARLVRNLLWWLAEGGPH